MKTGQRRFALARKFSPWALAAYWVTLATLTHIPVPAGPPNSDKVLHIAAYFVLGYLFALVLHTRGFDSRRIMITTIVSLFTFAILDELTQELVNRYCDPMDAAADAVGVVLALLLFFRTRDHLFPAK
ncbi:MAG: VanZ family protein [Planctomycetaceae bacterium]